MALLKYIFNEFICVIKRKYKFIIWCIKMLFMNVYVPVGVVVVCGDTDIDAYSRLPT